MCICFIAWNFHKDYPIVLIHNRDEFFERAASPLGWNEDRTCIYGKDTESNGTWLGVHKSGLFASLSNFRSLPEASSGTELSRGKIIPQILSMHDRYEEIAALLIKTTPQYRPFNVLTGDIKKLSFYHSPTRSWQRLSPGVYGFSNADLDSPWPKVELGKRLFLEAIKQKSIDKDSLLEILQNKQIFADDQLPKTGLPIEQERAASSIFVSTPAYGTRCSSLILYDNNGNISFTEVSYNNKGQITSTVEQTIQT